MSSTDSGNILNSHIAYNNTTKIYLSNSQYVFWNGYAFHYQLEKICLVPNSIKILSKDFFESITIAKQLKNNNTNPSISNFSLTQKLIIKKKTDIDFQNIADMMLYNKLIKDDKLENYSGKVCTELLLHMKPIRNYIMDDLLNLSNKISDVFKENDIIIQNTLTKQIIKQEYSIFYNIYINLLYELLFTYEIQLDKSELEGFNDFEKLKSYIFRLTNTHKDDDLYEYFHSAYEEIVKYETCVKSCEYLNQYNPTSEFGLIMSYKKNPNVYKEFLELIDESFKSKKSFVLKYIEIKNLHMSSGERAFQNIFSWLNIVRACEKKSVKSQPTVV